MINQNRPNKFVAAMTALKKYLQTAFSENGNFFKLEFHPGNLAQPQADIEIYLMFPPTARTIGALRQIASSKLGPIAFEFAEDILFPEGEGSFIFGRSLFAVLKGNEDEAEEQVAQVLKELGDRKNLEPYATKSLEEFETLALKRMQVKLGESLRARAKASRGAKVTAGWKPRAPQAVKPIGTAYSLVQELGPIAEELEGRACVVRNVTINFDPQPHRSQVEISFRHPANDVANVFHLPPGLREVLTNYRPKANAPLSLWMPDESSGFPKRKFYVDCLPQRDTRLVRKHVRKIVAHLRSARAQARAGDTEAAETPTVA
jgi:hypothetical protein